VGTGPWATTFTAPLISGATDCRLVGVWGRRPQAAEGLATRHGTTAVESLDALIDRADAIAFAVPPDVQAELALRAVAAGRAVLLDKPLGMTLEQAQRLADAIEDAGVVSQLLLTNRYKPAMRRFLSVAAGFSADGGRAALVHGNAMPGELFATPWRLAEGSLLDLGPHVLDALDAALGTIVGIRAAGDPRTVVAVTCEHESGAVSSAVMSGSSPVDPAGLSVEIFGPDGRLALDLARLDADGATDETREAMSRIAAEFAQAFRSGVSHDLDVRRGVYLQRLICAAAESLA
jgi:predicted dehydrogenase